MPIVNSTWVPYEMINWTTNRTLLDLAKYDNSIMGGWMGILILIGLFFVMMMIMSYSKSSVSIQSSLFITAIFSVLFWATGLVQELVMVIFIVAAAASLVLTWGDNG